MIDREDIVTALVAAAPGGELIGRVRLQKTAYFLKQLGLGVNLSFEYHHYGPYSRELDNATEDAKAFGLIEEDRKPRAGDGALYSAFRLTAGAKVRPKIYGRLSRERVAELIAKFARTNVTVLELAATVDWLVRHEGVRDWKSEVTKRKGQKVQGGRLERAVALLRELGLEPATH
jgi:uncharacterized protein YwgA